MTDDLTDQKLQTLYEWTQAYDKRIDLLEHKVEQLFTTTTELLRDVNKLYQFRGSKGFRGLSTQRAREIALGLGWAKRNAEEASEPRLSSYGKEMPEYDS